MKERKKERRRKEEEEKKKRMKKKKEEMNKKEKASELVEAPYHSNGQAVWWPSRMNFDKQRYGSWSSGPKEELPAANAERRICAIPDSWYRIV